MNMHVNVNVRDDNSEPLPNLNNGSDRNRLKDRIHIFTGELNPTYLVAPDRTRVDRELFVEEEGLVSKGTAHEPLFAAVRWNLHPST